MFGGAQRPQPEGVKDVTPSAAYALIQDRQGDPNFVILDVRTAEKYAGGHIEGAVNIPNASPESFKDDVSALDKMRTYLLYCNCPGGSRDGGPAPDAARIMADLGFTDMYVLVGGLPQWRAEGYAVVQ